MPVIDPIITLDKLPSGQKAFIKSIKLEAKSFRRKLLAIGITPGCEVSVVRSAPLGDPIQITMRGFQLCLRRSEAAVINIETCKSHEYEQEEHTVFAYR